MIVMDASVNSNNRRYTRQALEEILRQCLGGRVFVYASQQRDESVTDIVGRVVGGRLLPDGKLDLDFQFFKGRRTWGPGTYITSSLTAVVQHSLVSGPIKNLKFCLSGDSSFRSAETLQ